MQNKTPSTSHDMLGTQFWRRPTLARPIAVLPSGLQRFTAVFGMGTGGAAALLSPECGTARAVCCFRSNASAMSYSGDDVDLSKNCWFSDIYIQEVKARHSKASFCFEIFCLL